MVWSDAFKEFLTFGLEDGGRASTYYVSSILLLIFISDFVRSEYRLKKRDPAFTGSLPQTRMILVLEFCLSGLLQLKTQTFPSIYLILKMKKVIPMKQVIYLII